MANENLAPKDAKNISIILRSLGIEECEPKVILQLLEFAYKYSTEVLDEAFLLSRYADREQITAKDVKLALHTKVGKLFLPPPSRQFFSTLADSVNSKPLTQIDSENLLRAPNFKSGLYGMEYEAEGKESNVKKRKIH